MEITKYESTFENTMPQFALTANISHKTKKTSRNTAMDVSHRFIHPNPTSYTSSIPKTQKARSRELRRREEESTQNTYTHNSINTNYYSLKYRGKEMPFSVAGCCFPSSSSSSWPWGGGVCEVQPGLYPRARRYSPPPLSSSTAPARPWRGGADRKGTGGDDIGDACGCFAVPSVYFGSRLIRL
ncbi:uncharacterized protein [Physcomitrium patens]|uniref:uncharacterized protein isoform X3 n=1 Tax=Physcomitrium patens TaxID=3218 RepID=UPI003CCCBDE6